MTAVVTAATTPGTLLILGSVAFLIGAAVGVPGVFTERDPATRQRLIEEHRGRWRLAQPWYGLGPIVTATGVGALAAAADRGSRATFAVAGLALGIGALPWAWALYLRGTRIPEFACGTLPGWPFRTYVLLTIGGLALLGIGVRTGGFPAWLGWLTLGADLVFLAGYLRYKDIPPFVFYLLLLLGGLVLV